MPVVAVYYMLFQGAELDLASQQRQLEQFKSKGQNLIKQAQVLPGFDMQPLQDEVHHTTADWSDASQVSTSARMNKRMKL